jgi:hypothetical protein
MSSKARSVVVAARVGIGFSGLCSSVELFSHHSSQSLFVQVIVRLLSDRLLVVHLVLVQAAVGRRQRQRQWKT